MKIDSTTTLGNIQKYFGNQFQHLRLEFYQSAHEEGEGSTENEKLSPSVRVSDLSESGIDKDLQLNENHLISEFEQYLISEFGLNGQVFRRSGNLWLQTTRTDKWSLAEANRKGGHSQQLFNEQAQP